MQRLLYISTARRILGRSELDEVLRISRRNNAAVGVTGLLIVGGRRFLQALEGPEPAIAATFARIERDPRHFAVVKLADAMIETRAFGAWDMGYQAGGDGADDATAAAIAALIAPIEDPVLHGYFAGFAKVHARAA